MGCTLPQNAEAPADGDMAKLLGRFGVSFRTHSGAPRGTESASSNAIMETRTENYDVNRLETEHNGQGDSTTEQIRRKLTSAMETARIQKARLQERTVEGAKATDRAVRTHPYHSIGVVFGLGLIIGVLLRR